MSRTYKVRRNSGNLQGIKKEWILVNKRGAKKYQQMVNKRCRRLDKIAIAEGINEMIDDTYEAITFLEELFDDQYEEDYYENWYGEEPQNDDDEDEDEDDLRDWDDFWDWYEKEPDYDWLYWEEPED